MNDLNVNFSGMFLPPLGNQGGVPLLPHPSLVFPGYRVNNAAVGNYGMASKTMRAVRVTKFGGPEVLKIESIPIPDVGEDEILVRVICTGVNPVETYIREGQYSRLPDLPYTPGSDASGYVQQVGAAVTNLKVGDRVFVAAPSYTAGSYAEYIVMNEIYVFPLHHKMSFAQGASLGVPFFTAYKALMQGAQAMPGETVLIHGASGAVGTAAVQIARANGLTVVGTAGTKEGMNVVSSCGAHHVYNHNHKNYDKKMVEHLGTGFDIIIEHLANINLSRDLQMAKDNARVMVVGCRGSVNINPRQMMMSEATLQGVSLSSSSPQDWKKMGAAIVAGIESGWVNPVVNRVYGLEEVQQVHYDIIHSKGAKGKLVIKVANE